MSTPCSARQAGVWLVAEVCVPRELQRKAALMNEPDTTRESSSTERNYVLPSKFTFLLGFQNKHTARSPPTSQNKDLLLGPPPLPPSTTSRQTLGLGPTSASTWGAIKQPQLCSLMSREQAPLKTS